MAETRARLPEGMPTADEINARIDAKAEHVRESWIRAMEVRLVKDELNKCYRGEGVNAQQYCKDLAERYVSMLKENRIRGFVTVDREQKI